MPPLPPSTSATGVAFPLSTPSPPQQPPTSSPPPTQPSTSAPPQPSTSAPPQPSTSAPPQPSTSLPPQPSTSTPPPQAPTPAPPSSSKQFVSTDPSLPAPQSLSATDNQGSQSTDLPHIAQSSSSSTCAKEPIPEDRDIQNKLLSLLLKHRAENNLLQGLHGKEIDHTMEPLPSSTPLPPSGNNIEYSADSAADSAESNISGPTVLESSSSPVNEAVTQPIPNPHPTTINAIPSEPDHPPSTQTINMVVPSSSTTSTTTESTCTTSSISLSHLSYPPVPFTFKVPFPPTPKPTPPPPPTSSNLHWNFLNKLLTSPSKNAESASDDNDEDITLATYDSSTETSISIQQDSATTLKGTSERSPRKRNFERYIKTPLPYVRIKAQSFDCSLCSQLFNTDDDLRRHFLSHLEDGNSKKCQICESHFSTPQAMTDHFTEQHGALAKHNCDHCDKSYYYHEQLLHHISTTHIYETITVN